MSITVRHGLGLGLGLYLGVLALPSTAEAQSTPAASGASSQSADAARAAGADQAVLEEITVTARRTAENIQSVPISVLALDSETLRERSISTAEDLQMATPGVYLSGSGGRENVVYQIRGQTKALSGPSSPAVVSYFADVPDPTFGSSVPQYDIGSVQVLKGPQGTLFGRNTTGGAVLYYPTAPNYEFGGYVSAAVGNYYNHETQVALNLPLVDQKAALRIAGDVHQRDGYTRNLGVGGPLDDLDSRAIRVSLLLEPTAAVRNLTTVDYYKSDDHGNGTDLIAVAPGPTLLAQLGIQSSLNQQLALQQARGPFVVDTSNADFTHNRRFGVTNRTDADFGVVKLVNIFGYRDTHLSYLINVDGAPVITTDGTGFMIPAGLPVEFIRGSLDSNIHQYSDEVQLKGKLLNDKLDWLAGLFYLRDEPSGAQGNFVGFFHIVGTPTAGPGYNFITESSKAAFLHATYDLSAALQGLAFEAGARYTKDNVSSCTGTGKGNTSSGDVLLDDCTSANAAKITSTSINAASSSAPTWSVGLNWQVNHDFFTYLVTRRGYRAGGINSPTLAGRLIPVQSFDPETVTDVEIGMRSDWHLGPTLLRFNASAFSGWYDKVQVALTGVQTSPLCTATNNGPGVSPDGDCNPGNDPAGGTLLVNLGKSQVSGVDIDGEFVPTPALAITYAANFLSPRTKSLDAPAALVPYVAAGGIPFNLTAKHTFSAGLRYKLPLAPEWGELIANADEYYTAETAFTATAVPAYAVLNLRLDYNNIGGHPVDLAFFMRNAANREYISTPVASGTFLGMTSGIYGPPRMYGVEIRARFGK
jgi:iron complex outermembrane recepter protein